MQPQFSEGSHVMKKSAPEHTSGESKIVPWWPPELCRIPNKVQQRKQQCTQNDQQRQGASLTATVQREKEHRVLGHTSRSRGPCTFHRPPEVKQQCARPPKRLLGTQVLRRDNGRV